MSKRQGERGIAVHLSWDLAARSWLQTEANIFQL